MKLNRYVFPAVVLFAGLSTACTSEPAKQSAVDSLNHSSAAVALPDSLAFQGKYNEQATHLYVLKNKSGDEAAITNYGGRVVSLLVKDNKDQLVDVVLGHDAIGPYQEQPESYYGALIGRYGNRIAKGKFTLNGKNYQLQVNNGLNSLHGGTDGYQAKVWTGVQVDPQTLELSYTSKDGEGGYPGNLQVKVTYTLQDDHSLKIAYEAKTDKATPVNLTNHSFFNLNGAGDPSVLDHIVQLNADEYTPVDTALIPTGKLAKVVGTPFDFTKPTPIGERIDADDAQLKNGKGYDHNFVLRKGAGLKQAAIVSSPKTGIEMEVLTDEPGVQFYTGNFMTGEKDNGKGKGRYGYRSAFCLETQHFPDSPNQASFPSTILEPGKTLNSTTVYKFSVKK